ncbi:MAG: toprim domain-containing protein [Pseudomonadota bacterium]
MAGAKRGLWRDHKAGVDGDVLDFFAVEFCGLSRARDDFGRVIEEASRWCGLSQDKAPDLSALAARGATREAQEAREAAEDARKDATLLAALQARSEALPGSPAAAYLQQRGITALPLSWSYLPPVPGLGVMGADRAALVAWATDDQGRVKGGQRILILQDGNRAPEAIRKPAFAKIGGYPARIPATIEGGPLVVCEGPETAASIAQATGFEVWAVFGVGQFVSAPVPLGRQVVFCPDRDATGSPAAAAFGAACVAQVARGVDLWIAEAPEPEGSKRDLNDTLRRAGFDAVATVVNSPVKFTPRDDRGRFTGGGAVRIDDPAPMPDFLTVENARAMIPEAVRGWLAKALAWDAEGADPAPVTAIAASPGAGKSVGTREVLAGLDLSTLAGDVVFYAPSLALADEAAADAEILGAGWHVTRGRGAINPATATPMCDRAELAETVAKAGLSVGATLCKRIEGGQEFRCPFYESCAYRKQWEGLGSAPVLRFEASQYLSLPGDGSDRPTALRVIDETIWRQFTGKADLAFDMWTQPRRARAWKTPAERDAAEGAAVDVTVAAGEVLLALQTGASPVLDRYTAEDFERFAKAEGGADVLQARPDADDASLMFEAQAHAELNAGARKRAAVWRVLADCKRRGLSVTDRLRIVRNQPTPGSGEKRDVLRVAWFTAPPRDVPALLLDADMTPEILQRLYPGADLVRFDLRPNAHVVQLTDKTFSNGSLTRQEVRREAIELVRAEVYHDRMHGGHGVLAIATRAAVRAMFEDAGQDFTGKAESEVSALMMATPLHGARWLWFGPASLGRNDWQDFGAVVVIGREELPVDAVEDYARGFWGDAGEPLQFCQADAAGRIHMPEVLLPVTMADASGVAIKARAYPDARVRALHLQTRELATRQGFERLRLATAPDRKRVVLASKIPVPGLPVDELVTWAELQPTRLQAAVAEAAQRGGVLRMSASGLAADAPQTFPTEKAAARWLEGDGKGAFNTPSPLIRGIINGTGVFNPVRAMVRAEGQRGRATPALVVLPGDARAMVEAKLGPLIGFDLVDPPVSLKAEKPPEPVADLREARRERVDRAVDAYFAKAIEDVTAKRPAPGSRKIAAGGSAPVPDAPEPVVIVLPARHLVYALADDPKPRLVPPALRRYAVTEAGVRLVWDRTRERMAEAGSGLVRASVAAWRGLTERDADAWQ